MGAWLDYKTAHRLNFDNEIMGRGPCKERFTSSTRTKESNLMKYEAWPICKLIL